MTQYSVNEDKNRRAAGKLCWVVDGKPNGKRKRFYFPTKELAQQEQKKLNFELAKNGHKLSDMPAEDRAEWFACKAKLSHLDVSMTTIVNDWLARHDVRAKSVTLADAWPLYQTFCDNRVAGREIGANSAKSFKAGVRRFAEALGTEQLCDLDSLTIENYLHNLPLSTGSKNAHLLSLSRFFSYAVAQTWIPVHPIKGKIEKLRNLAVEEKLPEILTLEQAAKLLEVAEQTDPELVAPIAIGLFAGLRPTEVWRLDWSDILWEKQIIHVRAKVAKSSRNRDVQMAPNLAEWLLPYRKSFGRLSECNQNNLSRRITAAGELAGIAQWPQDGLRHSYGSYHYAATEDAPTTSARMGHRDTTMLFKHYNHRVSKEAGKAYFGIRPFETQKIVAIA